MLPEPASGLCQGWVVSTHDRGMFTYETSGGGINLRLECYTMHYLSPYLDFFRPGDERQQNTLNERDFGLDVEEAQNDNGVTLHNLMGSPVFVSACPMTQESIASRS